MGGGSGFLGTPRVWPHQHTRKSSKRSIVPSVERSLDVESEHLDQQIIGVFGGECGGSDQIAVDNIDDLDERSMYLAHAPVVALWTQARRRIVRVFVALLMAIATRADHGR